MASPTQSDVHIPSTAKERNVRRSHYLHAVAAGMGKAAAERYADKRFAELTAKARKELPKGAFALPGGRYPIPDAAHARNALARVAQNGSPEEKAKVRAAVKRRFPGIGEGGK